MQIDLSKVKWDEPPAIDLSKVQWDEAPSQYGSAVPQVNAQGQVIRQPDAIPGVRPSMQDILGGIVETPLALGTGIVASAVAPYAGVVRSLTGGQYGTQEGVRQGQELAGRVQQALTYQPQTRGGQATMQTIGKVTEPLQAIPFAQGSNVAALTPTALRQAANIARTEGGYLKNTIPAAIGEIPAVKLSREKTAAANLANSYENAPRIEAAQIGNSYGLLMDPEVSNPSAGAKIRGAIVGERNISNQMAEKNQPIITAKLKEDVGIPPTKKLDQATFDEAHAAPELNQPYEKVRAIPNVLINPTTLDDLENIKRTALIGEKKADTAHISQRLDNLIEDVRKGGDGNRFLTSVQQLRKEAQDIYRKKDPLTPLERREADAIMQAADILEGVLTDNLPFFKDRDAFLKARTSHAKLYQLEEATDLATGVPDPRVFAKMINDKKPITGVARDMGLFAANFPDSVTPLGKGGFNLPRITRATLPGAVGALVGLPFGPAGSLVGASIGTGIGEITKRLVAKNMLTPEFQAKNAVPTDYRPTPFPVNALSPVTSRELTVLPSAPRNDPNFVFATGETTRVPFDPNRPDARQTMGQGQQAPVNALRLGLDEAPEVTARLRAEDARRTRMAQMAEAEGLAAEGRGRAPTSGEVIFDLDPITGQLRPASQGIRGATPETFQDYTSTLRSAIEKMSGQTSSYTPTNTKRINTGRVYKSTTSEHKAGEPIYAYRNKAGETITEKGSRAFDMTAAEKVAFDKTRVDLAEVAPGFKALNDRAIADKMMDRNWVQETLQRAREKDAAFAEIEQRARSPELMGARADSAKNAEMLRQATEARDRVMNSIELLEEQLRSLRPDTSRKQQGPKTRAAKRNALRGDDEILNKLVP